MNPNINYRKQTRRRRHLLRAIVATASLSALPPTVAGDTTANPHRVPTRLPAVDRSVAAAESDQRAAAPSAEVRPTRVAVGHAIPVADGKATPVSFSSPTDHHPSVPVQRDWLPSGTSVATAQVAAKTLAQAHQEFRVGAWLSAETSAWEAIRWAAESIDQSNPGRDSRQGRSNQTPASIDLKIAKQAILEARDFGNTMEAPSPASIVRLARSHQTKLITESIDGVRSGTDASDRYLDHSRVRLAAIAKQSVEAAEAMDLLAAIYLRRDDPKTLPSATALCLRRAALQGQPDNASLATNLGIHLMQVGLDREAEWALSHAMSIDPQPRAANALAKILRQNGNPRQANALIAAVEPSNHQNHGGGEIKVPEITQLSPDEFASLSKSVVWTDVPGRTVVPSAGATAGRPVQPQPTAPPEQVTGPNSIHRTPAVSGQVNAKVASTRVSDGDSPVYHSDGPTANPNLIVPPGEPSSVSPVTPGPMERLKNSWKRFTNRS